MTREQAAVAALVGFHLLVAFGVDMPIDGAGAV